MTVNYGVIGSSPRGGASNRKGFKQLKPFFIQLSVTLECCLIALRALRW
jgi:hypothetical protein